MKSADFKRNLKAGTPLIGTWSHINHPVVVEIIGSAGLDFIVFDLEHGPHSFADLPGLYCAAERSGLLPVTRVPSLENSNVLRCLDSGSKGILVPHIDSLIQAKRAIESMHYGPSPGNRGVATLTRSSMFNFNGEKQHLASQNAQIVSVLMIEDKAGLDDLPRICELPELDVLFVGIYDLAQSLGFGGDPSAPGMMRVLEDAVARIRRANIAVGSYARDAAAARRLIDMGVTFVTICVDGAMLRLSYEAALRPLADLRSDAEWSRR